VILAALSLAGIGYSYRTNLQLRQSGEEKQALAAEMRALRQSLGEVVERVQRTEEASAQAQGELSVVTDRLKLTQNELARARSQARKIREDYAQHLAAVENTVRSELAAKASQEDVKSLSGDISGVRSDLEATKQNLQMARGELGTLIARNHEEIEQLRRLGQRDYFEFSLVRKGTREKLGNVMVELRGTNTKRGQFTVALYVDDMRLEKKNRSLNEPIYFYAAGYRQPLELVVNQVGKDQIKGYLSVPRTASAGAGS
jgi:chromosome segregation ATPase